MVLASLEPNVSGLVGNAYLAGRAGVRLGCAALARRFASARNEATARALFYGSITYLPLLWIAMIAEQASWNRGMPSPSHDLPAVNASLNALSGILLLLGFTLIHRRRVELHRKVMIAAFTTSSLFLVSYIVYHAQVGSVPFPRCEDRAAALLHRS